MKLTKRYIENLNYNGGWDVHWDSSISGFGVRVYPSGKKAYILSYRNNHRQKRMMTIGQTNKITLDTARHQAIQHLASIVQNIDPVEQRRKTNKRKSLKRVFHDYMERSVKPRNKTWQETERIFNTDIHPKLGSKPIQDISKADVITLIDGIVDRGSHIMANRTLAHLKRFLNWCVERDIIDHSPADKLRKPSQEISRDRVLSHDEIHALWKGCHKDGYPYGDMIKLLLVTGQRIGEVTNMTWDDVDLDNARWALPREKTKSNRSHIIPLPSLAIDVLDHAKQFRHARSNLVFTTNGKTPFSGFSKAKKRLDGYMRKKLGGQFEDWRHHDLRRTAASEMAALGVAPHIIERILNHSSGVISGVAAVYNRYEYFDEMVDALEAWDLVLRDLID